MASLYPLISATAFEQITASIGSVIVTLSTPTGLLIHYYISYFGIFNHLGLFRALTLIDTYSRECIAIYVDKANQRGHRSRALGRNQVKQRVVQENQSGQRSRIYFPGPWMRGPTLTKCNWNTPAHFNTLPYFSTARYVSTRKWGRVDPQFPCPAGLIHLPRSCQKSVDIETDAVHSNQSHVRVETPREPENDGLIEWFFRTIEKDVSGRSQAEKVITAWIKYPNADRIHSALGYSSPIEFMQTGSLLSYTSLIVGGA